MMSQMSIIRCHIMILKKPVKIIRFNRMVAEGHENENKENQENENQENQENQEKDDECSGTILRI